MKTQFKNNIHFSKLSIFIAFIVFLISIGEKTFAQDCGANKAVGEACNWGLDYPSCTLDGVDEKCVRIRFHFLNNSTNSSIYKSDLYCAELLDQINKAFKSSKIKFTFEDECVHRFSKLLGEYDNPNNPVSSYAKLIALIAETEHANILPPVPNGELWELGKYRHPDMEWTPNYINIYFVQNSVGASAGWKNANTVSIEYDPPIHKLIHEIGHTLGLWHTYQDANHTLVCLCNDVTVEQTGTGIELCKMTQDCLCDTPVDPWSNDLDGDTKYDAGKWANMVTCHQKDEIFHYEDGCGRDDLWDIPLTNYMSYYEGCRYQFTPCQKSLMHDVLEQLEPEVLTTDCNNSYPYYSNEDDIVIDIPTEWHDDVRPMKIGQRIIITETGSLTLTNYTITKAPTPPPSGSTSCPDLHLLNLWAGIYIEGKSVVTNSNGTHTQLGSLYLNNSVIEYAEFGINAPNNFGEIKIFDSTIRKCGRILNVTDPWPFNDEDSNNYPPLGEASSPNYCENPLQNVSKVYIKNSDIISEDIGSISETHSLIKPFDLTSQIKLNGGNLYIYDGSNISNTNSSNYRIGINSSKGIVRITNGSKISGFNVGIHKSGDYFGECIPRGLQAYNSSFTNCGNAIDNNSASMQLIHNYFNCPLGTGGIGYHRIIRNKFLNNLSISSPIESCVVEENCFGNHAIANISGMNTYTSLQCNNWNDASLTVYIYPYSKLPMSWGYIGKSSGNNNLVLKIPRPSMSFEQGAGETDVIRNYAEDGNPNEEFSYDHLIQPAGSQIAAECSTQGCPTSEPSPIANPEDPEVNFSEKDEDYVYLDSIIIDHEAHLTQLTGDNLRIRKEIINQEKIQLKNILAEVYPQFEEDDSTLFGYWKPRYNLLIDELSSLNYFLYTQQFDSLYIHLNNRENSDADVLLEAVNILDSIVNLGLTIKQIPSVDVEVLSYLGSSSFGDYTNILRAFLNMEYNIYIPWSDTLSIRSVKEGSRVHLKNTEYFSVHPNPTKKCFYINSTSDNKNQADNYEIKIFSLTGVLVEKINGSSFEEFCLSENINGLYIINIFDIKNNIHESKLISFIN